MVTAEPDGDRHHLFAVHGDNAVAAVEQLAVGERTGGLDGVEVVIGIGAADVTFGGHDDELMCESMVQ